MSVSCRCCTVVIDAGVITGELGRGTGVSLYYFLQLHVHLQLSQSKEFFNTTELSVTKNK